MFGLDDIIGGAAAGLIGGIGSYMGQQSANVANARMAREQMAFQQRMSDTSWQRGIADMKRAGVNPMLLAAKGGSGASTPTGATSTSQSTTSGISAGMNSAMSAAMLRSQLEKTQSDIALTKANTITAAQQALLTANSAKKVAQDTQLGSYNIPGAKAEAEYQSSTVGKVARWADHITDSLSGFAGLISPISSAYSVAKRVSNNFSHTPQGTVYNRKSGEIHYKGGYR